MGRGPGCDGQSDTVKLLTVVLTRIPILYVERDGTGLPVVRKECEGRAGKRDGQPAHTREAKLGCVFTQTTVDEKGYRVRDELRVEWQIRGLLGVPPGAWLTLKSRTRLNA